ADQGGNPDLVRESQRRRFESPGIVDEIVALDNDQRHKVFEMNSINKEFNTLNKKNGELHKEARKLEAELKKGANAASEERLKAVKAEIDATTIKANELSAQKDRKKAEADQALVKLHKKLRWVGNLVHDSVPVSADEKDNRVERTVGSKPQITNALFHHE